MKLLLSMAAAAAVFTAVPATSATVFDAFTSFDGTQGAGNFVYGAADESFINASFFTANTNCFIAGSVCLQAAPDGGVPGVTKSTMTSFQYNSVNVPNDRLLLHPGSGANDSNVFAAFIAPTSRSYKLDASFNVLDNTPSGVNVYFATSNGQSLTAFGGRELSALNPTYNFSSRINLSQGDFLLAVVNRSGSFNSDSTGLNFTLTAVPEPANWALLIAGFGLTGAAMRRRRTLATA